MVATLHPATEARLARLASDPIAEVHEATARTARQLADRLDDECATRRAAAVRLDQIRADLAAVPRGDAQGLLIAVRAAYDVLGDVSASLAPEGVRS
jgi:hypothetical protein